MSRLARARAWVAFFYDDPATASAGFAALRTTPRWRMLDAAQFDSGSDVVRTFLGPEFLQSDAHPDHRAHAEVATLDLAGTTFECAVEDVTGPARALGSFHCVRISVARLGGVRPEVALVVHVEADVDAAVLTPSHPLVVGIHAIARPWSPLYRSVRLKEVRSSGTGASGTSRVALDVLLDQAALPKGLDVDDSCRRFEHEPHVMLVGFAEPGRFGPATSHDRDDQLARDLVTLTVDPLVAGRYSDSFVATQMATGVVDLYDNWRGLAANGSFTVLVDPSAPAFVAAEDGMFQRHLREIYWLVVIDAFADSVSVGRYLRPPIASPGPARAVAEHAAFNQLRADWELQHVRTHPLQHAIQQAIRSSTGLPAQIGRATDVANARLSAATAMSAHQTEVLLVLVSIIGIIGVVLGVAGLWEPAFSEPAPWVALCTAAGAMVLAILVTWRRRRDPSADRGVPEPR